LEGKEEDMARQHGTGEGFGEACRHNGKKKPPRVA